MSETICGYLKCPKCFSNRIEYCRMLWQLTKDEGYRKYQEEIYEKKYIVRFWEYDNISFKFYHFKGDNEDIDGYQKWGRPRCTNCDYSGEPSTFIENYDEIISRANKIEKLEKEKKNLKDENEELKKKIELLESQLKNLK